MAQKQIRYINTQSGRSMVEMLGTLAIMGVLTIGGIAGYRYAINKSNANTILGAVSQMAVTASTELTTQGSLTLPEWKDTNGNLSISGTYGVETAQNNDGTFSITVSNMNDEVCERIKGMDWKVPEDVAINDESDVCDQGEANKIAFVFSNTIEKLNHHGENGKCKKGYTGDNCEKKITCANGGKWTPNGCECPNGWYGLSCDTNCDGFKDSKGKCYSCSHQYEVYNVDANECHRCDNRLVSGTNCYSCSRLSMYDLKISAEECHRCEGAFLANNYCKPCPGPTGQVYSKNTPEECARCSYAFLRSDGYCEGCEIQLPETTNECGKCPNRVLMTNNQGKTVCTIADCKGIRNSATTQCYPCSSISPVYQVSGEDCNACADQGYPREMYRSPTSSSESCILKYCPNGYFHKNNGACDVCGNSGVYATTEEWCNECMGSRFYGADKKCYSCNPGWTGPIAVKSADACAACGGEDKRFMGSDGKCYACGNAFNEGINESPVVDNRDACVNSCSGGVHTRRFMGAGNICYSCKNTGAFPVENAEACTEPCHSEGGYTGLFRFYGSDGLCYSCSTTDSVAVDSDSACTATCNTGTGRYDPARRFRGSDGLCYNCSTNSSIAVKSQADCIICNVPGYTKRYYNASTGLCNKW